MNSCPGLESEEAFIIDGNTIRKKIIDDRDATRGFREWPKTQMIDFYFSVISVKTLGVVKHTIRVFCCKNSVALIPWWLFPRSGGEFLADEESLLELTTAHLNIGMRGVPVGTCRTSFVTPTEGVHYCGYPISELAMMSPEDIIYLLFNKDYQT